MKQIFHTLITIEKITRSKINIHVNCFGEYLIKMENYFTNVEKELDKIIELSSNNSLNDVENNNNKERKPLIENFLEINDRKTECFADNITDGQRRQYADVINSIFEEFSNILYKEGQNTKTFNFNDTAIQILKNTTDSMKKSLKTPVDYSVALEQWRKTQTTIEKFKEISHPEVQNKCSLKLKLINCIQFLKGN